MVKKQNVSYSQPRSFELITSDGVPATMYKESFTGESRKHRLAFLRKDLLDAYLKATNSCLVWGIWGEKEPKYDYEYRMVFNKKNEVAQSK